MDDCNKQCAQEISWMICSLGWYICKLEKSCDEAIKDFLEYFFKMKCLNKMITLYSELFNSSLYGEP